MKLRNKLSSLKRIIYKIIDQTFEIFVLSSDNVNFNKISNYFKLKNRTLSKEKYSLNFFNFHFTNLDANGPIQKDEAIFLFGLLKCLRPNVVLEFGFNKGHSAYTCINAIDNDSTFITCDINPKSYQIFKKKFAQYKNMKFVFDDMRNLDYQILLNGLKIDFVFFDAVHDFEINKATFLNLLKHLNQDAILVIHDTGIWDINNLNDAQRKILPLIKHKFLTETTIAHQIDERIFSNYLVKEHDFRPIHLHTSKVLRHGITILQRSDKILVV